MNERLIISSPFYITEPRSRCGYCHGEKSNLEDDFSLKSWFDVYSENHNAFEPNNCTLGFPAELMSIDMYDRWCNMGFRRSGKFLYKTDILRNCCRLYTIRTTPDQVTISKDLKTTIKRFKKEISDRSLGSDCKNEKAPNQKFDYITEIIEAEVRSKTFKTVFEPALFTQEKYDLFVKYQENVHHDFKNSKRSFKNFLCDSPFSDEAIMGTKEEWDQLNNWRLLKEDDVIKRRGPAHECYYFSGKLIAIAVTDFLPSGISSVYFIWDPDYHKWSLGKLSALRELSITKKINSNYYYMGYYIDDCKKMAYKAKYGGELLDLCQHQYIPLEFLESTIALNKLFTITSDCSKRKGEFWLNDKLLSIPSTITLSSEMKDVAELLYGCDGTARVASNDSAEKLSQLGIPFAAENARCGIKDEKQHTAHASLDIPNIFPGLVPLPEILEMVEKNQIFALNNNLLFYETQKGAIRPMLNFSSEPPENKKLICNLIRCIGLQNIMNALVII